MSFRGFSIPNDMTLEESIFLGEVKNRMLQKLQDDRTRFVFLFVIEMGNKQRDAARVLGVHETEISRQMRYIKERLQPFREGYR